MEHSQVVTLFHEFGHLLHHVLAGRHKWIRFSGVATEWDFVEAPSQMLAEWAGAPDGRAPFPPDEAGTPTPAARVPRTRDGEEFATGSRATTTSHYAALPSLPPAARPDSRPPRVTPPATT